MNSSFETSDNKEDWLTPPEIVKALGAFDLDPCATINPPQGFIYASKNYTILDNGLLQEWHGRVWANPPYGKKAEAFLKKLSSHGNGIALIFARTETKTWFESIWPSADALLFIKGRVCFYNKDGTKGGTSGSPSVLVAYGVNNALALKNSGIKGAFVSLKSGGDLFGNE